VIDVRTYGLICGLELAPQRIFGTLGEVLRAQ
jgi:hypothetical protein